MIELDSHDTHEGSFDLKRLYSYASLYFIFLTYLCNVLYLIFFYSFRLMIELDSHEGSFLSICRHYLAIYNTAPPSATPESPAKKKDEEKAKDKKKDELEKAK